MNLHYVIFLTFKSFLCIKTHQLNCIIQDILNKNDKMTKHLINIYNEILNNLTYYYTFTYLNYYTFNTKFVILIAFSFIYFLIFHLTLHSKIGMENFMKKFKTCTLPFSASL